MSKRYAKNAGSALKKVAMDIFAVLLMVFLSSTIVLMSNALVEGLKIELVRIMVAEGATDGISSGDVPQYVIVSAKQIENGVQYYVAEETIAIDKMKDALIRHREKGVSVVITRFDKRLPHGAYITILDIAKQSGITDVFDAYTKKEGVL